MPSTKNAGEAPGPAAARHLSSPGGAWAPALSLLAEHADEASRIVTARLPLGATVEQGLEVLAGPERARHAKILVRVCASG